MIIAPHIAYFLQQTDFPQETWQSFWLLMKLFEVKLQTVIFLYLPLRFVVLVILSQLPCLDFQFLDSLLQGLLGFCHFQDYLNDSHVVFHFG